MEMFQGPALKRVSAFLLFGGGCMADNAEIRLESEGAAKTASEERIPLADLYLDNEYDDVKGIEILNTFWNTKGIPFSAEVFDELIKNFDKYRAEKNPHIKIDHTAQQAILKALTGEVFEEGTELPNLGFISRLYHDGKSMFADFTRVPRRLKEIIFGGKMFKAVSPEATWNYRGTGDKLITSVVMTNNPAQKHILDVHMNETHAAGKNAVGDQGDTVIRFSGDILIEGGSGMPNDVKDTKNAATEITIPDAAVVSLTEKITAKLSELFKSKEPASAAKAPDKQDKQDEGTSVSLSEHRALQAQADALTKTVNELKVLLTDREKEHQEFSERVKGMENDTRAAKTEAVCQSALMAGVPPVVVNYFKPILLSELGEKKITLSEKVGDKVIDTEKTLSDMVQGFFKVFPNKIKFTDQTRTIPTEPGAGDEEEAQLSEINKRAAEYQKAGMPAHEALEKAGMEVLIKKGGE